jgi:hypothetical protein
VFSQLRIRSNFVKQKSLFTSKASPTCDVVNQNEPESIFTIALFRVAVRLNYLSIDSVCFNWSRACGVGEEAV